MHERNWSKEEVEYLEDKWGTVSIGSIAKNLGRSVNAIKLKARKIGLSAFLENGDYITFYQLLNTLGVSGGYKYKMISWVKNRGCPVFTKKVLNNNFLCIRIDDFWKWAENNKQLLNFSNFTENSLGKEPEWVKSKRREDIEYKSLKSPQKWTKSEDDYLRMLLKQYKYSYKEISERLGRSEGAIQRRCLDLKIIERPLRESPHSVWEDWQFETLIQMIRDGKRYESISSKIGKSTKAIRGRVYREFNTESLDKVEQILKERKVAVND